MSLFSKKDYARENKKAGPKKAKIPTQNKSKSWFCRNCNKANKESSNICEQCGKQASEPRMRKPYH